MNGPCLCGDPACWFCFPSGADDIDDEPDEPTRFQWWDDNEPPFYTGLDHDEVPL